MTTKEKSTHRQTTTSKAAPAQLATVTDLTSEEVQAITNGMNPLIADAFTLYVKTKNFHWHLSGSHFRDYHHLFDKQAKEIFKSIDIMAERVRRIGGTTIRSIGQIAQMQTISDDNEDFVPAGTMVKRLMEDNTHMAQMLRAVIQIADKNHDRATASVLEVLLDQAERRKWFLFEIVQGKDNAN